MKCKLASIVGTFVTGFSGSCYMSDALIPVSCLPPCVSRGKVESHLPTPAYIPALRCIAGQTGPSRWRASLNNAYPLPRFHKSHSTCYITFMLLKGKYCVSPDFEIFYLLVKAKSHAWIPRFAEGFKTTKLYRI